MAPAAPRPAPALGLRITFVAGVALLLAVLATLAWQWSARQTSVVRVFDAPAAPAEATGSDGDSVRVLVASMLSPRSTIDQYAGLVEWLGRRIGRRGQLLQRRGYFEANEAVRAGETDLAFVCTGALLDGLRAGQRVDVVAVPLVQGRTTYRAVLIVPSNSPVRRLEDLRGATIAYVDPLSLTGRLWARHRLRRLGLDDAGFFARVVYTGSHDRSVQAVATGLVGVATVDELVWDKLVASDVRLSARVRVLEASPPFGIPPVVARAGLDPVVRVQLANALQAMHADPDGHTVLAALGIERFVPAPPDHFDSALQLAAP